jgi:HEAT repeat protein
MGDNIQTLVNRLNRLHEGWKVQCQLIALGQEAIPFLVDFLLAPPSMFPQPRCWAAEALAIIGGDQALEGLCKVLNIHDVSGADPVIRFAEETVRDCAAEELERLGDRRAIPPLLQALQQHALPRAAHALAHFDADAAIPLIVHYLEDDFVRERMASALFAFREKALDALMETLQCRTCLGGDETPASIGRRAAAARLLGELGDARAVNALRPLLNNQAREVRIEAAGALTRLTKEAVFAEAVLELIADLDADPSRLQWRAEDGLCTAGPAAVCLMAQALEDTLMDENNSGIGPLSHDTLVKIIRLLGHCPSPDVISVLRSVVVASDVELRAEAIHALGRLQDPEGIPLLLYILQKDGDPCMCAIAAEALGKFDCEAVVKPLVGALENRHPIVRQAAARALARLGSVAKPCLQRAIKQYRWALSLDRQRLVWVARHLLRGIRPPEEERGSLA